MSTDEFPIRRVDHVRHFVNNARQAAFFYQQTFGFGITGYRGLETGEKDQCDYVLEQNELRLVFSAPTRPGHPQADKIAYHGDYVQNICFEVDEVDWAYKTAVARGAESSVEPETLEDDHGSIRYAAIKTYGDTVHGLINRDKYSGPFLPGFRAENQPGDPIGLIEVDHCVGNVELGKMNVWVKWYEDVLGFKNLISFDDNDISTEYTSLMSKVMSNGNGRVKFPINEPAAGKKKSQIDEYLEFFGGAGVQHVAMRTDDIVHTVSRLQARGIQFLSVPRSYYDMLPDRVGTIDEDIDVLAELGILVDRDDEGYLLQIFTKPVTDRPTLFYEIIHRKGATSFGKGNFKALFESIEREQALRGTL
jgi:4-hydroxyphenylpyruvate dioxygenase